ncbi:MAG: esterase, partial [Acidobacteria bacterium]
MHEKGSIVCIKHESEVLKGNPLGDNYIRDVYVYLPPNYSKEKRFPTVYVLAGFTGRGKMLLNDSPFTPNFAERMDKLIANGKIKPMIAVLPDCFTFYGGSQYINSTATGRYEDYLCYEIVPFIDANFNTLPKRESRAVMGKSSGGYGALIMAMRHSDLFALACSISGDCYFELCYLPDFPKAFRAIKGNPQKLIQKFWNEEERKAKTDFDGLNIIAMSACYSP